MGYNFLTYWPTTVRCLNTRLTARANNIDVATLNEGAKIKVLRLILIALILISFQAYAKEERDRAVSQANNSASDKRIALVIGNSAYKNSPLKNPVNDAKDMAKKLRGLGFDVIERSNLKTKQIGSTLSEFRSKLTPGAVALVFYAGHGLQIKGINYLPAVDADINSEEDVSNQSIAVNQIMDVLDTAKTRLNLVFLDACRNNPYASRSFRSADRGLARVSAPSGTLISYATKPGSVAADGDGRNGLYTSKLLAQMDSKQQIEQTIKHVVTDVKAASQGKQEPWMEGSIEGDFCFAGCAAGGGTQIASTESVSSTARVKSREEIEQDAWESVRASGNIRSIKEYLKQYPKGQYVGQAKILITTLKTPLNKPVEPIATPAREDSETALWVEVGRSNTREDYQAYLAKYPKGKYDILATARLKKLDEAAAQARPAQAQGARPAQAQGARPAQAQGARPAQAQGGAAQQEQNAWEAASREASEASYQGYLNTYPQGRYAAFAQARLPTLQTGRVAQEKPGMVNVGSFSATKPGENDMPCRDSGLMGAPGIRLPNEEPFSEYVRKVFLNELKVADTHSAKGKVILTGNLDSIDLTTFLGSAWELTLTVNSSNGKSLTIYSNYSFTANFDGKEACVQASQAFRPAVKSLVDKVVRSPEFPALMAQ